MYVFVYVSARHEHVLPPIVVEIGDTVPPTGHLESVHPQSCRDCLDGELALTQVPEKGKCLLFDRRHPDIGEPGVPHIPEVRAHSRKDVPILAQCHPRIHGVLLEAFTMYVVEELVGGTVISDEDIRVAIAVVIGYRHSHAAPE